MKRPPSMKSADVLPALLEFLQYDPDTGAFHWKKGQRGGLVAGRFCASRGGVAITLAQRHHQAHRLAWLYVHGDWPNGVIDHINGDPTDNRLANLRDVSIAANSQNQRKAMNTSTTGVLGVEPRDGRFGARVQVGNERHYLGRFDTAEEAHAAYVQAKRRLHEGNTL